MDKIAKELIGLKCPDCDSCKWFAKENCETGGLCVGEAEAAYTKVLSHFATDEQVRTELSKKIWRLGHVIVSQYEHTQPPSEDDYDNEKYTKSRERAENIADLILKDSILPFISLKVEAAVSESGKGWAEDFITYTKAMEKEVEVAKRETAEAIFKELGAHMWAQYNHGWWIADKEFKDIEARFLPASQKEQEGEQK